MKIDQQISELRCEPNPGARPFVRVYADDQLLTELAHPFQADTAELTLCGDPEYPDWIPEDTGWAVARLIGDYVLWIDSFRWARYPATPKFGLLAFDVDQYRSVIEGNPSRLPELQPIELRSLLQGSFPANAFEALYTIPKLRNDPRGAHLVRRVDKNVFGYLPERIDIVEAPDASMELRIGLDREGFPEAVWRIGSVGDQLAILFAAYPDFPLWLAGEHVTEALKPLIEYGISGLGGVYSSK